MIDAALVAGNARQTARAHFMRWSFVASLALAATLLFACEGDSSDGSRSKIAAGSGGSVSAGGATLIVPPGALPDDTDVSIALVPADDAHGGTPGGVVSVGARFHVDLGDRELITPARLELPVNHSLMPAGGDPAAVVTAYFDDAAGAWMAAGGALDDEGGRVVTETTHASWWTVFYPLERGSQLTHDRRLVYLSATDGDSLKLCPYVADVAVLPNGNPCGFFFRDNDLDPINIVLYGVEPDRLLATLEPQGWTTSPSFPLICIDRKDHSAYAGANEAPTIRGVTTQYFSGVCAVQFHVRFFKVPDTPWTLGAVHFEMLDNGRHTIAGSWEGAELMLASALDAEYHVEQDRLLVQRACPDLCTFRGWDTDGWATLVTARGEEPAHPLLTIEPSRGAVGAGGRVSGRGFPPDRAVKIYGDPGRANVFVHDTRTGADGAFSYTGIVEREYVSPFSGLRYPTVPGRYVVRAQVVDDPHLFAETMYTVDPGIPPTRDPCRISPFCVTPGPTRDPCRISPFCVTPGPTRDPCRASPWLCQPQRTPTRPVSPP
jgi:hypothetical protein